MNLVAPVGPKLPVLYADDWITVVHKPAGLLVHRTMLDRHATQFALQLTRNQFGKAVYPVHRLDRGTSGALLFAFDAESASDISAQFATHTIRKTYLAVVRGHPPACGEIDHPLSAIDGDGNRVVKRCAQMAITRFRRLATVELPHCVDRYPASRYALLELMPVTGRRHQIRRHLKHVSHPIIGDATYGKGQHNRLWTSLYGNQRLLLACTALEFKHPASGAQIVIPAPLAVEFLDVLARCGLDSVLRPGAR